MIILGIDPGIAIVGWGVVECNSSGIKPLDYGSIQTEAQMPTSKRLKCIFDELNKIIEKYSPVSMAIEEIFWNTNQKTGIRVSEARGVILLCGEVNKIGISEYTPLQVKQAVVGYGRADKKQVITMVTMLLGLSKPPKPDDTADALAIAICHANCSSSKLSGYFNRNG